MTHLRDGMSHNGSAVNDVFAVAWLLTVITSVYWSRVVEKRAFEERT